MLLGYKRVSKSVIVPLNISIGQKSPYMCILSFTMANISWGLNWIKISKKDYLTDFYSSNLYIKRHKISSSSPKKLEYQLPFL